MDKSKETYLCRLIKDVEDYYNKNFSKYAVLAIAFNSIVSLIIKIL